MKMRTIESRTIFHRDGTVSYYSTRKDRYVRHESCFSADGIKQFDEATATKIIDRITEPGRKKGELRKSVACKMFEKIFFHEIRYRLGREPRKGELGYLLPHGGGRYLSANILDQGTGGGIHVYLDGTFEFTFCNEKTVPEIKKAVRSWIEKKVR